MLVDGSQHVRVSRSLRKVGTGMEWSASAWYPTRLNQEWDYVALPGRTSLQFLKCPSHFSLAEPLLVKPLAEAHYARITRAKGSLDLGFPLVSESELTLVKPGLRTGRQEEVAQLLSDGYILLLV